MIRTLAAVIACAATLTACGGDSSSDTNAADVAKDLAAQVSSVDKTVKITEANDPNNLLGRDNGYKAAVVLYDSRVTCDELGASCGAAIEEFSSAGDAKKRRDYIQSILKGSPALGSEYDHVKGNVLVRVSGELDPSAAKEYEKALG